MKAISFPATSRHTDLDKYSVVHKLQRMLLWIFVGSLLVVLALPIVLLFIGTAVPWYLSLTLLLGDVVLCILLIRGQHTARNVLATMLTFLLTALLAVILSQFYAATPPITDASGSPLPNSIAVMEKVVLGGSEQWITLRGKDINKPVLLYLGIGGPGAGGFPASALTLAKLEENFVVVNWDQPGTGKSYDAVSIPTLTVERFVSDAHELTLYLRQRFDEPKIYVLGLSWGTILGIKLVQQYPDLFYAYVGNGQMVNTTENDRLGYDFALNDATERGDRAMVNRLVLNGPPPYGGAGMAMKYALYNNVLFRYMESPTLELILLLVPQFAHEYGLIDKVNFARGLIDSFPVVYSQLRELDFTTQAADLRVPVYFLVGRGDINAMAPLVERYYNILQAPIKELIWLEGGHGATPEQLADTMVNRVLAQTYPKVQSVPIPLNGPSDVDEVEAFLDDLLPRQLRDDHIAGAGVAVVVDGKLLLAKGYGFAELTTEQPLVADQTLLRTDSTGKLIVWTAVMQLVEQGKVDLDADINTYLDFQIPATFPEAITLKHLLSHSAGFEDQGYFYARDATTIGTSGEWLANHMPERVRAPGVVAAYSNYGTALAGYIVERVSGLSFEQFADEEIFQALGMQESTFQQPVPEALAPNLTTNYRYANGEMHAVPAIYLRVPAIGEGHTTVTDMAQFMIAHLTTEDSPILRSATLRQMHSQLFTHDPRVSGMAYGFAESNQNGQHLLRHEGNNPGVSSSALFLLPEKKLGVYVAYNSNGGFGPGEEFRQAFLDHYFPIVVTPPTGISLTTEQFRALAGSYRSTRMFHSSFAKVVTLMGGNYADIKVTLEADGTFTTQGLGGSALKWIAIDPEILRLANGTQDSQGDLVFVSDEINNDEQNRPTRLLISNNPYRAYEKVAWYESTDFHLFLLMLCELIFLLAVIAISLRLITRKRANAMKRPMALWLLASACLLALLFPLGLLVTVEESLLYGVTWAFIAVLAMPLFAIALTLGSLTLALGSWHGLARLEQIQYGTILAAMITFVAWLNYWNLLGFRF